MPPATLQGPLRPQRTARPSAALYFGPLPLSYSTRCFARTVLRAARPLQPVARPSTRLKIGKNPETGFSFLMIMIRISIEIESAASSRKAPRLR